MFKCDMHETGKIKNIGDCMAIERLGIWNQYHLCDKCKQAIHEKCQEIIAKTKRLEKVNSKLDEVNSEINKIDLEIAEF